MIFSPARISTVHTIASGGGLRNSTCNSSAAVPAGITMDGGVNDDSRETLADRNAVINEGPTG